MAATFQPMNINFGLLPPPAPDARGKRRKGRDRKAAQTRRALVDLEAWLDARAAA